MPLTKSKLPLDQRAKIELSKAELSALSMYNSEYKKSAIRLYPDIINSLKSKGFIKK